MKLRKENGLSQEEFGNEINVSRQAVSKWELDVTKPDIDKIQEIAKRFNVSYNYLLDDKIESDEKNLDGVNPKKKSKIVQIIILIIVIIYCLISLYKFITLFRFYKIADSFSEENYWMNIKQVFNDEIYLERDITKIVNKRLEKIYNIDGSDENSVLTEGDERIPYEIEFLDRDKNIVYKLHYDEEKQMYSYYDRKLDAINEEEFQEILDVEKDGIRKTTLDYIPSSFKQILFASVNPFCIVSAKKREMNLSNLNGEKHKITLNNDYLISSYNLQTGNGGNVSISISYDYVQDHFVEMENPLDVYHDIITYDN